VPTDMSPLIARAQSDVPIYTEVRASKLTLIETHISIQIRSGMIWQQATGPRECAEEGRNTVKCSAAGASDDGGPTFAIAPRAHQRMRAEAKQSDISMHGSGLSVVENIPPLKRSATQ
jgi:hypothetical protein